MQYSESVFTRRDGPVTAASGPTGPSPGRRGRSATQLAVTCCMAGRCLLADSESDRDLLADSESDRDRDSRRAFRGRPVPGFSPGACRRANRRRGLYCISDVAFQVTSPSPTRTVTVPVLVTRDRHDSETRDSEFYAIRNTKKTSIGGRVIKTDNSLKFSKRMCGHDLNIFQKGDQFSAEFAWCRRSVWP